MRGREYHATTTAKMTAIRVLLLLSGRVPFLIPKPQYRFLNLSCEILGQLNDVAMSPLAIVRLIRSLWHLNERVLAFRLDDLYVRNANHAGDTHRRETSKGTTFQFSDSFDPNIHRLGLLRVKPSPRRMSASWVCRYGLSLNVERLFSIVDDGQFS